LIKKEQLKALLFLQILQ